MNYFTPAQVPVTAWLANKFGVCDQWFASVPTHTFTNRVFAHCAAAGLYYSSSDQHIFGCDQFGFGNEFAASDGPIVPLVSGIEQSNKVERVNGYNFHRYFFAAP